MTGAADTEICEEPGMFMGVEKEILVLKVAKMKSRDVKKWKCSANWNLDDSKNRIDGLRAAPTPAPPVHPSLYVRHL